MNTLLIAVFFFLAIYGLADIADHPEKIRAIIDEALEKVHAWPRATSP